MTINGDSLKSYLINGYQRHLRVNEYFFYNKDNDKNTSTSTIKLINIHYREFWAQTPRFSEYPFGYKHTDLPS